MDSIAGIYALRDAARLEALAGHQDAARAHFAEARQRAEQHWSAQPLVAASVAESEARWLAEQGRADEAVPLAESAIAARGRQRGLDDPSLWGARFALAIARGRQGRGMEARKLESILDAAGRRPIAFFDEEEVLVAYREALAQLGDAPASAAIEKRLADLRENGRAKTSVSVDEMIEIASRGIRFQPPHDPGWRTWDALAAGRQDSVFGMMRQGPAAFFLIGCVEAGETSLETASDALATQAERSQQRVVFREATTLNGMQGTLLLRANEGNDPLIRLVEWVTVQHGVAYVLNYWLAAPPASTSAVVPPSSRDPR